jgi:hypothetical protein
MTEASQIAASRSTKHGFIWILLGARVVQTRGQHNGALMRKQRSRDTQTLLRRSRNVCRRRSVARA